MSFDELGDVHARYLKGLDVPYSVATEEMEAELKARTPGSPISERVYNRKVREAAGQCSCGGSFTQRAKARCPRCRSKRLRHDRSDMILCD